MNINTSDIKGAEISRFQKMVQTLIIVMFVPIMLVSVFSIYIYSSTKSNSSLPSGFGLHIVTIPEEIDLFSAGQKVVVKEVDTANINVNDYVAFFVATEDPSETGSEIAFKKVLEIIEDNGVRRFRFANEMYYQIENAVVGRYYNESAITISILTFFSTDLVVILMALIPLLILLVLLGLYIIEQFSVTRLNKDIKLALSKAESAGFDTNIGEVNRFEEVDEKQNVFSSLQPKKASVAHINAKVPPRKAPNSEAKSNLETVDEPITKEEIEIMPKTPVLPPKKAPNSTLPPKKAQKDSLPPKKTPSATLPPKKTPSVTLPPKKAPNNTLPPKKEN